MENKRDSFIFYRSFYEAIKDLPAEEKADILDAICELSLNFEEIELSGISKSLFILIKPQLEANIKRYENGKKPKTKPQKSKTEAKPKQTESKSGTNVNDNVNDNVNPNDNKKENNKGVKRRNFIPPTIDQIKAYCYERKNNVYAQRFIDHYSSNGWMVGKNKMKDWKAAVRTWEKNNFNTQPEEIQNKVVTKFKTTWD